jgi:hypothetical protein
MVKNHMNLMLGVYCHHPSAHCFTSSSLIADPSIRIRPFFGENRGKHGMFRGDDKNRPAPLSSAVKTAAIKKAAGRSGQQQNK